MPTPTAPSPASGTPPRTTAPRRAAIVSWVFQGLGALLFTYAAVGKLTGSNAMAVEAFDQLGTGPWFLVTVGSLELLGAIALLVPLLAGLAALCLTVLAASAAFVELFVLEGGSPIAALVCFTVAAVVTVLRRRTIATPFALARGALSRR
jgi:putative oxidoreductase